MPASGRNPVKILAIAPYDGLRELILEVARTRKDIEVDAFTADMREGADLARELQHNGYSVIISRAGTAELIERRVQIPVVDMGLSAQDMLRAIRQAQSYSGRFAIVGFPKISRTAQAICELLQYRGHVVTVNSEDEIRERLAELKEKDFNLVIGDVVTTVAAKRIGFNIILVTSGRESVVASFDQAVKLVESINKLQEINGLYFKIVKSLPEQVFAYGMDKSLLYSSIHSDAPVFDALDSELKTLVGNFAYDDELVFFKNINDQSWKITGRITSHYERDIVIFHCLPSMDITSFDPRAVYFRDSVSAPLVNYETFNTNNRYLQGVLKHIAKLAGSHLPVMISGQRGTGKDTIAYSLFQKSNVFRAAMPVIDCRYTTPGQLRRILKDQDSFVNGADMTIYFKNMQSIDEELYIEFEKFITAGNLQKKNRIVMSCVPGQKVAFDKSDLMYFILYRAEALCITMPTLNERASDIPSLAILYVNELNIQMGTQVIGFQPQAMDLLQKHRWVGNIDQFKKVIKELIFQADSPYIGEEETRLALDSQNPGESTALPLPQPDLSGNLDAITREVIRAVLEQENMNQTRAARRLGISRSTMWRKLGEAGAG
ncbi:MAG: PrpR N-terminal domain-containing protein [Methylobacteriaceae bacterium]|jgi:transcriptional regulator with PAS, ATPase and Fis domain|nr:PrpR N-terminal domain-containing protein [Methylobacteriaceae bacterium]